MTWTEWLYQNYWPSLITFGLGYALGRLRSAPKQLNGKAKPPEPEFSPGEFIGTLAALLPVGFAIADQIKKQGDSPPKPKAPPEPRDVTPKA